MIILVTGAAGLLGGEIAATLTARGHGVLGLVHKSRDVRHGAGERADTIEWKSAAPDGGEIALVAGDVAHPKLGLDPDRYEALAGQVDMIVHCAAITTFDDSPENYEAINLGGTQEMLDLAKRAGAGFLQVSTAYVCGERDGPIAEDESSPPTSFANPYEQSKFEAELLVRMAMSKGLPAAIARPSVIVGREADGAIAAFDAIYAAFRLLAEGRLATIPAKAEASIDFVPIDHVVNGIVTIAERMEEAVGHSFHLTSSAPMPVPDFFDLIGSYDRFSQPELIAPEDFDPSSLSPFEARLHQRIAVLYQSYFCRNPLFQNHNVRNLIGSGGPAADRDMMKRQIDFAIRAGYLRRDSKAA